MDERQDATSTEVAVRSRFTQSGVILILQLEESAGIHKSSHVLCAGCFRARLEPSFKGVDVALCQAVVTDVLGYSRALMQQRQQQPLLVMRTTGACKHRCTLRLIHTRDELWVCKLQVGCR